MLLTDNNQYEKYEAEVLLSLQLTNKKRALLQSEWVNCT